MWDFTSSGLTQKSQIVSESNRYRIGPVRRETNFGIVRLEWKEELPDTRIHLEGYGDQGQLLTRQTLFLKQLTQ